MSAKIQTLIDKQDNAEIIRDQIAAILAVESVEQQALAVTAGKDPNLWALRVFRERANPWEFLLNEPTGENPFKAPVVNVWHESQNTDLKASNVIQKQTMIGVFHIDCFGYGISKDIDGGGHTHADEAAALEANRVVRLCRNILMSAPYTYLGLRKIVGMRMPQSITYYQPRQGEIPITNVMAARFSLQVSFIETSPQYVAETLETLFVELRQDTVTGELLAEMQYDYPLPEEE